MFRNERSYKTKRGERDFNTKQTNTDFDDKYNCGLEITDGQNLTFHMVQSNVFLLQQNLFLNSHNGPLS